MGASGGVQFGGAVPQLPDGDGKLARKGVTLGHASGAKALNTGTAVDRTSLAQSRFGTLRRDAWWRAPVVSFVVLLGFVIYGSWVAFANAHYFTDPYLSPFYSPCLASNCAHQTLPVIGDWWTLSPALLILPFPLGFRLTCYYYRKAYYRSFWMSPPACAVPDGHKTYSGETRFPLIFQNAHRYAFYAAAIISLINTWDAVVAMQSPGGFGFGLGNIVLWVNVIMLWAYTLS